MAGSVDPPAGVVSFVLTDIEGSTRLLRADPGQYDRLLDLHNAVLRSVWSRYHGFEIGTEGDSFLVAFATADDAVAAAAAAQRAVFAVDWPVPLPVRVRVGVHTGYAQPHDQGYRALAVHQTARIAAAAHGGQVLLSEDTARRLEGPLADARVEPVGRFRVRDFDEPVPLHRVVVEGVPVVTTAPRVRPADRHNLVPPTSPMVGRDADVAAVTALLGPGAVVTVVGPGGVGKTRLAIEVAVAAAPRWPDGVWFVDLAPVTSESALVVAITQAVGAPAAPGADAWEQVSEHLRGLEMLVVLDNCEHLVEPVARVVSRLLRQGGRIGVLATSRIHLGLRVENVHRLGPLTAGPEGNPGVELFLRRASPSATFDLGEVTRLVEELDGLPLAIELAAARTTALSPSEILARLRSTISVLASRDPELPERQRSLDRLLDWSVNLLPAPARGVLFELGAFAGGFDLDTAVRLGAGTGIPQEQVAELVWTLLDHSLLFREIAAGETRYRLPATVRSYARDRGDGEASRAAVHRLARIYAEDLGPDRPDDRAWAGRMALEIDNVRSVTRGLVGHDEELGHRLAWSMARYHDVTDAFRVGIDETISWTRLLPSPTPTRVALLAMLADLHLRLAELDLADAVLQDAERLAQEVGVPAWADAAIPRTSGEIALRRGHTDTARAIAEAGLATASSPRGRARLWNLVGLSRVTAGDLAGAVGAFEQELAAGTEAGVESFAATTHGNLAEAYLQTGNLHAAADHQRRCLVLARAHHQPVLVAFSVMVAARISADLGDPPAVAVRLQAVGDRLLEDAGYALYPEDLEVRAALLARAETNLGPERYRRAVAEGAALEVDDAADLADQILQRAAHVEPAPAASGIPPEAVSATPGGGT